MQTGIIPYFMFGGRYATTLTMLRAKLTGAAPVAGVVERVT
jgi:hypothetical protein